MEGTKYGRQGKNVIMIFIQNKIPYNFLIGHHPLWHLSGDFLYFVPVLGDGPFGNMVRNFDFEISFSPIMSENFQIILLSKIVKYEIEKQFEPT